MPALFPHPPASTLKNHYFWRCLSAQFVSTALESGPSFTKDRRYSIRGEFGAVYFSASRELSAEERARRGGDDLEPAVCIPYRVSIDRIVDLRRETVRRLLRVDLEDLVKRTPDQNSYFIPQQVARTLVQQHFNGLLVPSVHDPKGERKDWFNLVLYPSNILRKVAVEVESVPKHK